MQRTPSSLNASLFFTDNEIGLQLTFDDSRRVTSKILINTYKMQGCQEPENDWTLIDAAGHEFESVIDELNSMVRNNHIFPQVII